MSQPNPEPSFDPSQSPCSDELAKLFNEELKNRELTTFIDQTVDRIHAEAERRHEAYAKSVKDGTPEPNLISPMQWLKTEALAHLLVLAKAHCVASHRYANLGNEHKAHVWAVDEGSIAAAMTIVQSIQVP